MEEPLLYTLPKKDQSIGFCCVMEPPAVWCNPDGGCGKHEDVAVPDVAADSVEKIDVMLGRPPSVVGAADVPQLPKSAVEVPHTLKALDDDEAAEGI